MERSMDVWSVSQHLSSTSEFSGAFLPTVRTRDYWGVQNNIADDLSGGQQGGGLWYLLSSMLLFPSLAEVVLHVQAPMQQIVWLKLASFQMTPAHVPKLGT